MPHISRTADGLHEIEHTSSVLRLTPERAPGRIAARAQGPRNAPALKSRTTAAMQHRRAVARSLRWAEESAARGDHAEAIAWLQAVEDTGEQLQSEYEVKRRNWFGALAEIVNEAQSLVSPPRDRDA